VKATLSIIDDSGNRYQGEVEMLLAASHQLCKEAVPTARNASGQIEFGLPIRAFVRKHAAGKSGGAAKFTVLLAFLAKGAAGAKISSEMLQAEWGRLTAHLGAFNHAHATRAKDRAWVDSPGQGIYRLGPSWREAFNQE